MIRPTRSLLIPLLAGSLALGACGGDVGPMLNGEARLTVQLTDAPSDYLESAVVEIGRIELRPDSGAAVVVVEDAGAYDLLRLQDGVTADLAELVVEPGVYTEMRMIVTRAEVTLKEPYTFQGGGRTRQISVPSGAQSGIKIKLASEDGGNGVEIRAGETVLVIDFDVAQNFVMQGNAHTPAGIRGFLFTPSLRATVRDVAGSIAGSVTAPQGVAVENLRVTARRAGAAGDDVPAATLVKADGSYRIHYLAPASYTVALDSVPAGHAAAAVEASVGARQHVTGVTLGIRPAP